ncbi:hypothetical protein ANCCAN_07080 [Ancylostoma caninum]|uniref:Uncharacterized protein n=1 Tax=Ancylostoma caninum TaxID=29170 RepID=A0A368GRA8_ANCCA|nr:hypothetical protein ANCCAN_07080 [Ancylostoma caninum]
MKGYGISMPPVNGGITSDMEMLLEAFKAKQSVRLIKFHEVAIDYELSSIYAGRLSLAELIEFEECLLKAAFAYTRPTKGSVTSTPRTLTERIFGVYATFVLYYAQPIDYVSKILVTPNDLREMRRFCEEVLLPGRHLDTVGCLYKLYVDDAFSIVAYVNSFDPVCHRRYDMPNADDDVVEEDEKHTPLAETAALMEDPILKTMAHVQEEIERKQNRIEDCPKVAETKDNFLTRINKIFATLKNEIAKVDTGEVDEPFELPATSTSDEPRPSAEQQTDSQKGTSRLSIKDKAYSSKIVYSRTRRYADPNMHENFADLAVIEPDEVEEEPTPSAPVKSPPKKRKRTQKTTNPNISSSADATTGEAKPVALVVDVTLEAGASSPSKSHSKVKAPRQSAKVKAPRQSSEGKTPKTPRQSKAKKAKDTDPQSALAALEKSPTKGGRKGPAPPPVDVDFEEKLKLMEASLNTSNDDRVRDLLG